MDDLLPHDIDRCPICQEFLYGAPIGDDEREAETLGISPLEWLLRHHGMRGVRKVWGDVREANTQTPRRKRGA